MSEIDVTTLAALVRDGGATVVDVREPHEYAAGHVPGALSSPMSQIVDRLAEVPALPGPVHLVCATGNRSGQVTAWLTQQGYEAVNVTGGTVAWRSAGLPVA